MRRNPTVLILDVATSGVNPTIHTILEVAAILVDCRSLEVLETYSGVVRHDRGSLDSHKVPDFHKELVELCYTSEDATRMAGKEGFLLAGEWTRAGAVCNRNVDFDLKFLAKHMPILSRALPRLQIELQSQEHIWRSRGVAEYVPSGPRTFRAGDDAAEAYAELLHWIEAPVAAGVQK